MVAILLNDIVIDDGKSTPSVFLQQAVKHLEVIREVVLSEETK